METVKAKEFGADNNYDIVIFYLTAKTFLHKENHGYELYRKMYSDSGHNILKRLNHFKEKINSIKNFKANADFPVVLNNDGNPCKHRDVVGILVACDVEDAYVMRKKNSSYMDIKKFDDQWLTETYNQHDIELIKEQATLIFPQ